MTPSSPVPAPALVELRVGRRASLLLRSAKLICQSGQYVCLIRDVSEGGTKLRLFHEMPPEKFVFLELGNGEIHAMENVWAREAEAGFRFISPVDVDEFIAETSDHPRRGLRLHIERPAMLFSGEASAPAMLHDFSQGGARVVTDMPLALHQVLRLVIDGLPERFARLRWRQGRDHGLVFERSVTLDELAQQALVLQPFAAGVEAVADTGDASRYA